MKAIKEKEMSEVRSIAQQIGDSLANESGNGFGFVCIWRKRGDPLEDGDDYARQCSVGEFLSRPENQRGTWLIDGGWGGPPGAIHVRWNESEQEWENGGYGGRKFQKSEVTNG